MKVTLMFSLFYLSIVFPGTLIKNGRLANSSEYLDTVALVRKNKIFCTGTLLSENIVISAKHCARKKNKEKIYVFQGDTANLEGKSGRELSRRNRKHKYMKVIDLVSVRNNDVVLLLLEKPLQKNYKISFINEKEKILPLNENSFSVAGFGRKKNNCRGIECENAKKTVIDNFLVQKSCLENPYYINLEIDPYYQRDKSGKKCRMSGYPNMIIFTSGINDSGEEQHLLEGDSGAGVYFNKQGYHQKILWGVYRGRLLNLHYKENDMAVNLLKPELTCALEKRLYLKYKKSQRAEMDFLSNIYRQYKKLTPFCLKK